MNISDKLLAILACPLCKGGVEYVPEREVIECHSCQLAYPVKDDIPVMLIDEAQKIGS